MAYYNTPEEYNEIYKRDNYICQYCGFDGRWFPNWLQLTKDHIRPKKKGGETTLENLTTCCHYCNTITKEIIKYMDFDKNPSLDDIKKKKKELVNKKYNEELLKQWKELVVPNINL